MYMTQPKFSMVHNPDLCEEEIIDGFAIYAFLTYSDCEESARQQDCLDDTEEEESINGYKKATVKRTPSGSSIRSFKRRSRSDSRASNGDTSVGSIYLENENNIFHRSVPKSKGRPTKKGYVRRYKVKIKHELHTDLTDPTVSDQQLCCLYNDYLQDRLREEEAHKFRFTLPYSMDEKFVHSSLDALDSNFVKKEPSFVIEKIKNELKEDDGDTLKYPDDDDSGKIPDSSECDTDLAERASRHSKKREIRLPVRYHQSGILLGSQWVVPEYEAGEKVPKKRIKVEESDEQNGHSTPAPRTEMVRQALTSEHINHPIKHEQIEPCQQSNLPIQLKPPALETIRVELPTKKSPSRSNSDLLNRETHLPTQLVYNKTQSHSSPQPQPPMIQPSQSLLQPPPAKRQTHPSHLMQHQKPPPSSTIQPSRIQISQNLPTAPQPLQEQQSHWKPLYSCENQRFIPFVSLASCFDETKDDKSLSQDFRIESRGNITVTKDLPKMNSAIKSSDSHLAYRMHQEKLERIQLLRKQQESNKLRENNTVNMVPKDFSYLDQSGSQNIVSTPSSVTNNIHPSSPPSSCCSPNHNQQNLIVVNCNTNLDQSSSSSSSLNTEADSAQKNGKIQELRQLYRDLYFENRPERRVVYSANRMKPRVNKKSEVEEAIKVIKRLTRREKQLDYIKKLLAMWNTKLTKAQKVVSDPNVPPKAVEIVKDILKTYQNSKSYKVTEAWDSRNTKPKTPSSSSSAVNPVNPPLVNEPEFNHRPVGTSVIKRVGSVSSTSMASRYINPIASQSKLTTEPNNLTNLTLPIVTTITTTKSETIDFLNIDHSSLEGSLMNKGSESSSSSRIQTMVSITQSQSSNQISPLQLPPLPPPSLGPPMPIVHQLRPPAPTLHQSSLPLIAPALPGLHHHHASSLPSSSIPLPISSVPPPSALVSTAHHQHLHSSMKPIPVLISPNGLNHNPMFSNSRGFAGGRLKSSTDVHLCTMPRLPLTTSVTSVTPTSTSGVTTKPTIIKPTTFLLAPGPASPTSPVYRILVKGDTINRVILTPQVAPQIYKKTMAREPFLGSVLEPSMELSVQSDNQSCN